MNYFALVRHGNYRQPEGVPSALLPWNLNDEGCIQAKSLQLKLSTSAEELSASIYPIVYSSTLLRAWQTARIFTEDTDFLVQQESDLCERSLGSAANLSVEQIEEIIAADPRYLPMQQGWKSQSLSRIPLESAESLIQAGLRVANCIKLRMNEVRIQRKSPQLVVFVGHGAAFRHAAYTFGQLNFDQIREYSMYHCQPVIFSVDNEQSIKHVKGNWKLRASKGAGD